MSVVEPLPMVSVVMAVYNGGADLAPTIRSVLEQQDCEFEFIVVNDGSTDSSARVLDDIAQVDSRLRVVHHANQGLTRSLILACSLATGAFIARQDCADRSYPGRLARLAACLRDVPTAVAVASGYCHVGPHGETLARVGPRHSDQELRGILLAGNPDTLYCPHHGTVMFRASAYRAAGGYRQEFYFAQDLDLWTRLAHFGEIVFLPEELYEARFTRGSISANHAPRQQFLRELIAQATRARATGASETEILERASRVRLDNAEQSSVDEADIDYFLGSVLASRRDPAARGYLLKAVRRRPWMARAWLKLIASGLLGARHER